MFVFKLTHRDTHVITPRKKKYSCVEHAYSIYCRSCTFERFWWRGSASEELPKVFRPGVDYSRATAEGLYFVYSAVRS